MSCTPVPLAEPPIDPRVLVPLVSDRPKDKKYGWNMNNLANQHVQSETGVTWGSAIHNLLTVERKGHMQFVAQMDNRQFFWLQSDEERSKMPRLYPYALIEYPFSFLRLYKEILEKIDIQASQVIITLCYINIRGMVIALGNPNSAAFDLPGMRSERFRQNEIEFKRVISNPFNEHDVVRDLASNLYEAFGLPGDQLPFYNSDTSKFEF
jgi:hypothetical protein